MTDEDKLSALRPQNMDKRQLDELIGLASGIVADSDVNQKEAEFLKKWLIDHSETVNRNPLTQPLLIRIKEMLADNYLDKEEAQELLELLKQFASGTFELQEMADVTGIPFDASPPEIDFSDKNFCLVGTFAFGAQKDCADYVREFGGAVNKLVRDITRYVIVGAYVQSNWQDSPFGGKITKAAEMRDKENLPIAIISEKHWIAEMERQAPNKIKKR